MQNKRFFGLLFFLLLLWLTYKDLRKAKAKRRLRAIWKLRRYLKEYDADILHAHCSLPDLYGKFAALSGRAASRIQSKNVSLPYIMPGQEEGCLDA